MIVEHLHALVCTNLITLTATQFHEKIEPEKCQDKRDNS